MAEEGIYEEAMPFETSSNYLNESSVYSNCFELNLTSVNTDAEDSKTHSDTNHRIVMDLTADDDGTDPDIEQEVIDDNKDVAAGTETSCSTSNEVAWNVKLRKNWKKRQEKRKNRQKNSENRQSISDIFSGSISRWLTKASNRLSIPINHNLSIFRPNSDEIDVDIRPTLDVDSLKDENFDDDYDDEDNCLWSDTEFDTEFDVQTDDVYANVNDYFIPEMTNENETKDGLTTKPEKPTVARRRVSAATKQIARVQLRHRKEDITSENIASKPTSEEKSADGDRTVSANSKPPVKIRPPGLKLIAATTSRRFSNPGTCEMTSCNEQPTTTSVESQSPDCETVSADSSSSTSGFSSAGSDVSKTTSDETAQQPGRMTKSKPVKGPKPALKPKPTADVIVRDDMHAKRPLPPTPPDVTGDDDALTSSLKQDDQAPPPPPPREQRRHQPSDTATEQDSLTYVFPPAQLPGPRPFPRQQSQQSPADFNSSNRRHDNNYTALTRHGQKEEESTSTDDYYEKPVDEIDKDNKTTHVSKQHLQSHNDNISNYRRQSDDKHRTRPTVAVKPNSSSNNTATAVTSSSASNTHRHQLITQSVAEIEREPWYFGNVDRLACEDKVRNLRRDGAFVVRRSQTGGDFSPCALTVYYHNDVFNLLIRCRTTDHKFALGSEKPDEHVFNNILELISFHKNNFLQLTGDRNSGTVVGRVQLTISPQR